MDEIRSREPGMMQAPWFKVLLTFCSVLVVAAICIELYRRVEAYGKRVVEAHPVNAQIEISNPPAWLDRQIVSSLLDEAYQYARKDEATYNQAECAGPGYFFTEIAGQLYTETETVDAGKPCSVRRRDITRGSAR